LRAKESFSKHGGRRKNDREPAASTPAAQTAVAKPEKVQFQREQREPDGTVYRIHQGPDAVSARAWLQQQLVTQALCYLVVETPEGNYGRDKDGIYEEPQR